MVFASVDNGVIFQVLTLIPSLTRFAPSCSVLLSGGDSVATRKARFQKRVAPTGMLIRQMKTRWGSMTSSGKIVLNRSLLHAPVACIDYVIAHELCHRLHANHTRAFWKTLRRAMPDESAG